MVNLTQVLAITSDFLIFFIVFSFVLFAYPKYKRIRLISRVDGSNGKLNTSEMNTYVSPNIIDPNATDESCCQFAIFREYHKGESSPYVSLFHRLYEYRNLYC